MGKKFKVAGIIAEYNPFHRGHSYQISQTRISGGADYVLVVMSGDFVQRGEPALVDKYLRTRMALEGGADLVIELPTAYATASAEDFALAGVSIMDTLGVVDILSFGAESAGTDDLLPLARLLAEEPEEYQTYLKEGIRQGLSFPAAREEALTRYIKGQGGLSGERLHELLSGSNQILGLEYMKALIIRSSSIKPLAVRRQGAAYHDTSLDKSYPSATAIRHFLNGGAADQILDLQRMTGLRKELAEELAGRCQKGDRVVWDDLMSLLDYQILYSDLTGVLGCDSELAHRIRRIHRPGMTFRQLVESLHARQRTDTALQRALLHLVLQLGSERLDLATDRTFFPYIRVLGFRKTAGDLLSAIRDRCPAPVIQKYSDRKMLQGDKGKYYYDMDEKSEALYEQIAAKTCGREPVHVGRRQQLIL